MRLHLGQLLLVLVGVAFAHASVDETGGGLDDVDASVQFHPEDACSQEGGLCGMESECPMDARHPSKGLCPSQQSRGAECCFAVPNNVRNCRRRGGECLPPSACGRAPRDIRGQCSEGEICCILLF